MYTVKAIILKSIPHSEQQHILHAYSEQRGYMSFITPMTLFKRKNNHAILCMQVVEIEFIPNERGGLHKLKSISPLVNTSSIYFDVYKMNIALLWGEILNLVLRDAESNASLYEYIEQSIEYLSSTQEDIANFNLFFLFRLSGLLGFSIDTSTYNANDVFNINDGNFYHAGKQENYYTGPHSAKIIYQFCSCSLDELKNISLNQQSRKILLDIILLFMSFHLNINFNIRSIQVIREIFS